MSAINSSIEKVTICAIIEVILTMCAINRSFSDYLRNLPRLYPIIMRLASWSTLSPNIDKYQVPYHVLIYIFDRWISKYLIILYHQLTDDPRYRSLARSVTFNEPVTVSGWDRRHYSPLRVGAANLWLCLRTFQKWHGNITDVSLDPFISRSCT